MPSDTACAKPSAFLSPNFLSIISGGCFQARIFSLWDVKPTKLRWTELVFSIWGNPGTPHIEKMSVSDNQNKKGWCKSSSFQGRYWDLRWKNNSEDQGERRNWKWSRGRGNKNIKSKVCFRESVSPDREMPATTLTEMKHERTFRLMAGVQARFSGDLTRGQQGSSWSLRTGTERHNEGRITFSCA